MAVRDAAGCIVRKTPRGIVPAGAYDAEVIAGYAMGQEFNLRPRARSRSKLRGTYWLALKRVIDATGKWPTAEHLHERLLIACGYTRQTIVKLDGKYCLAESADHTSDMTERQFREYFDKAMPKLSKQVGYNVLAFLEDAA